MGGGRRAVGAGARTRPALETAWAISSGLAVSYLAGREPSRGLPCSPGGDK